VLASDVLVDLSGGSSRRVKQIFLARRTADHALCQWTRSCPLLAGAASVLNGPPHRGTGAHGDDRSHPVVDAYDHRRHPQVTVPATIIRSRSRGWDERL
jgi:hypothetical protein